MLPLVSGSQRSARFAFRFPAQLPALTSSKLPPSFRSPSPPLFPVPWVRLPSSHARLPAPVVTPAKWGLSMEYPPIPPSPSMFPLSHTANQDPSFLTVAERVNHCSNNNQGRSALISSIILMHPKASQLRTRMGAILPNKSCL